MKKLYNNRFIFIVSVSIIFIMILAFSSVALTKKQKQEFNGSGYILSSSNVLNFDEGTTYRLNLNEKIVFTTNEGKIYEVDPESFIHYEDGSIGLLSNGAFVDLKGISEEIAPYYNITSKSLISYSDGGYTIQNGSDTLYFEDILIRISDNKYMVAGKNLSVKVPGVDGLLEGEYFELTFIEDGVLLIQNDKDSYEVTADGSTVYIGDKTIIDMSTKNVLYEGELRLSMSELTIDGNENITIIPIEDEEESKESTDTSVDNNKNDNDSNNNVDNNTDNDNNATNEPDDNENDGSVDGDNDNENTETPGEEETPIIDNGEVSVELVKLMVGTQSVTGIFQVNNQNKINGTLDVTIINSTTNEEIKPTFNITATGYLSVYADNLDNNTTYMLTIKEENNGKEIQYFQRMFTTDSFGVSLKKVMVTDSEIDVEALFTDESTVSEIGVELYDKEGNLVEESSRTLTKENNTLEYINLNSNTTYTIKAVYFKIGAVTYKNSNGYISKTLKTLKQKPTFKGVLVEANSDNSEFQLSIKGVDDPDSSITKYTYYIYKDLHEDEVVYKTTTAGNMLTVSVGENGIEANTNYRFKAVIEYNDNEKVREIETGSSAKFISTGAQVSFTQDTNKTTFNTIYGDITLKDPDCTVPMPGRAECPGTNSFTISYYINGVKKYKNVTFEATENADVFKITDFYVEGLSANTTYTFELNGDVYEQDAIVSQVLIGNSFTGTTTGIPSLKIEKKSDNTSTYEYPINVTLALTSNSSNNTFIDNVRTMTVKLYALDASSNKVQIGNTVNLTNEQIKNLLYNKDYQITNKFFGIENMDSLVDVIKDETGWAYVNYMIEFTDAYDVVIAEVNDDSNKITIDDNEVNAYISKSYLLSYYSKDKEASTLSVTELKNSELSEKNSNLDGSTIAAYKLDATTYVEDILRQYYGVTGEKNTINWDYVFYILDKDGNKIYTSDKQKSTTKTFYLDDENIPDFDRGNVYSFAFQIVTSDGLYPENAVIGLDSNGNSTFNPVKENPSIALITWDSNATSITFLYKITKDIDDAFYENKLYIYDANYNLVDTVEISKSEDYQNLTISNLKNNQKYTISYNKVNAGLEKGYSEVSKGAFLFDGYYDINSSYTLKYKDAGNMLSVIINDSDFLSRSDAYSVTITSSVDNSKKEFVFTKKDLENCDENGNNCLNISYSDLEEFQGANTTVTVKGYYENGLIGLNQKSTYYVFKSDDNTKYLTVSSSGTVKANSTYADGIYTYTRDDMKLTIKNTIANKAWNDNLPGATFNIAYTVGGVTYSNYGSYNPKVIKETTLTTDDNKFNFSSIVPMVKTSTSKKINEVTLNLSLSGLTKNIVNNEFKKDDYKVYVDLYEDEAYTNPVTLSAEVDLDNLSSALTYNFTGLKPNHTYYYKIYAYILNSTGSYARTELYDYRADGVFEVTTKSITTLTASEIFGSVDAYYESKTSKNEYSTRTLEIQTTLKKTENFKLTYSITDASNNKVFEDEEITDISELLTTPYGLDDNFVFGEAGYKLKITATTLDDNAYTLVLYEDSFVPHLKNKDDVTELREPTFKITNSKSFVATGENKYSISFNVAVNDSDLVITNADYYVKVTDDFNNTYTPVGYTLDSDGFIHLNNFDEVNTLLTYKGLDADTDYSITVKAPIYRNNESLSVKEQTVYSYDYITTGNEYNLKLGTGSLDIENNVLTINYKNASNLNNITRIVATVRRDNKVIYTYDVTGDAINLVNENGAWKLVLDLSNTENEVSSDDRIRVIINYFAKDLDGTEGLVSKVTYANYEEE